VEKPTSSQLTSAYAGQNGAGAGAPYPGRNPPDWHTFVNLCQSGADLLFANALGDQAPQSGQNPCSNFGSGGFLSNLDNAYVYSFVSQAVSGGTSNTTALSTALDMIVRAGSPWPASYRSVTDA
jgi:hypothetical protein